MRAVPSSLAIRLTTRLPALSPSSGPTVVPDDFTGKPYKQCQMTLGVSAASEAQHGCTPRQKEAEYGAGKAAATAGGWLGYRAHQHLLDATVGKSASKLGERVLGDLLIFPFVLCFSSADMSPLKAAAGSV